MIEDCVLPGFDGFFAVDLAQNNSDQTLLQMKNELNVTKDKLDNLDANTWHKHTRFTLLVDKVSKFSLSASLFIGSHFLAIYE